MTNPANTGLNLKMNLTYFVPCEKVYEAWTKKEILEKWFAPSDDFTTTVNSFDLKVDGKYEIAMKNKEGTYTVFGTFKDIKPNQRLVFTWAWKHNESDQMLVGVELVPEDDVTGVALIHMGIKSEESKQNHENGWNGCLTRLENYFKSI